MVKDRLKMFITGALCGETVWCSVPTIVKVTIKYFKDFKGIDITEDDVNSTIKELETDTYVVRHGNLIALNEK